jgi:prepilin-type N-terminal cleavage/methylation domain-containing protein
MINKKGFTMPELLVTLLVIGVLSIIITQLLTSSTDNSIVYSEYSKQQFTVQQVFVRLSKEIEEADDIVFDPADKVTATHYRVIGLRTDGSLRRWKLDNGELSLYNDATSSFDTVISGLDTNSAFLQNDSYHCLTVVLKPKATTSAKNRINITEPIVAQFSYEYK